jgi:hypothetical protein
MEQTNNQSQTLYPMKQDPAPVPPGMGAPVAPNVPGIAGMAEGGLLDEGGSVDPVSGNEVPSGSLKEEVRDDIPAKLSEGEFVFPADVVRFIGLDRLMKMRQLAKDGLRKMEEMGQMGNADEATMEDDGDFESNIDGLLEEIETEEVEEPEEKMEMAEGGAVPDVNTQMEKSMQPKMKPTEIIKEDLKRGGFTKDEQKFFKILAAAVAKGVSSMTQINNTVFVGTRVKNGEFRVHMFTQDSPQMMSGAIEKYADLLIKSGVPKIHSVTENTKIISLLQSLGYLVEVKKEGDKYAFTVEKQQ